MQESVCKYIRLLMPSKSTDSIVKLKVKVVYSC